ncbi:MAG: 2'-5' RNA ligase family protein [Bacteroidia bacterium]
MKEQYSLLAIPSSSISRLIFKQRGKVFSKIGVPFKSQHVPPHITLFDFTLPAGKSKEVTDISIPLCNIPCFKNLITGPVSTFEKSGTLFLPVEKGKEIIDFRTRLIKELRNKFPALKRNMSISSVLHLTIGRSFNKQDLDIAESELNVFHEPEISHINELQLMLELSGKMKLFHTFNLNC